MERGNASIYSGFFIFTFVIGFNIRYTKCIDSNGIHSISMSSSLDDISEHYACGYMMMTLQFVITRIYSVYPKQENKIKEYDYATYRIRHRRFQCETCLMG